MAKKGLCQAPHCWEPLPASASTGRPRKYCSPECKAFAYRSRQREAARKAREEVLKIESYPDQQAILERILNDRYTAEQLTLILTLVENQFVAERIKRTQMTHGHQLSWGNAELAVLQQQLRRILLRISNHLSRQTPEEVARRNREAETQEYLRSRPEELDHW